MIEMFPLPEWKPIAIAIGIVEGAKWASKSHFVRKTRSK